MFVQICDLFRRQRPHLCFLDGRMCHPNRYALQRSCVEHRVNECVQRRRVELIRIKTVQCRNTDQMADHEEKGVLKKGPKWFVTGFSGWFLRRMRFHDFLPKSLFVRAVGHLRVVNRDGQMMLDVHSNGSHYRQLRSLWQ